MRLKGARSCLQRPRCHILPITQLPGGTAEIPGVEQSLCPSDSPRGPGEGRFEEEGPQRGSSTSC